MHDKPAKKPKTNVPKAVSVSILYALSIAISLSGAVFTVCSIAAGISFRVLNVNVPGCIFGAMVLYLGLRYVTMVRKLKREIYKTSSGFDWSRLKPSSFFAKAK